jgi:hypothetical protein
MNVRLGQLFLKLWGTKRRMWIYFTVHQFIYIFLHHFNTSLSLILRLVILSYIIIMRLSV